MFKIQACYMAMFPSHLISGFPFVSILLFGGLAMFQHIWTYEKHPGYDVRPVSVVHLHQKFSLGHGRLALSNDLSGKELCSRPQEAIEHHLLGGGRGHREAVKNPRNPLWWRGSSNAIIEDFQSVSPICLKGLPSKDIPQNPEVIF